MGLGTGGPDRSKGDRWRTFAACCRRSPESLVSRDSRLRIADRSRRPPRGIGSGRSSSLPSPGAGACLPFIAVEYAPPLSALTRQACHFQLPGALEAIKKSLTLIWRTEGSIEAETKRAFIEVRAPEVL